MFSVCALTSGSSGNSILCSNAECGILIDSGASGREIESRISAVGDDIRNVKGLIITHEHSDHINSAGVIGRRYGIPIYIRAKTYTKIADKLNNADIRIIDRHFNIGGYAIECFPVSHDAVDPIGLIIKYNDYKVGIVTDIGFITGLVLTKLSGVNGIVVESNYEDKMLIHSDRPMFLKQRIKSRTGHLSNDDAVKFIGNLDKSNLKFIMLYHISEEHNSYELAYRKMRDFLDCNNFNNINLSVGFQSKPGIRL